MIVNKTPLEGLLVIEPDVFSDERGYFFETYSKLRYKEFDLDVEFVQDNLSRSSFGTVRGLHYQGGDKAQGKLCQVIKGKVLDVAVDIRFESPTFGQHFAIELSGKDQKQFWIPPGFAHGFSVLSDEVFFSYKCTNYYNKSAERAILFNDPDLNINWKVSNPIVSEKDLMASPFKSIREDFVFKSV